VWWRAIGWVRLFGKWFGCNGEFVSATGAAAGEGTGEGRGHFGLVVTVAASA